MPFFVCIKMGISTVPFYRYYLDIVLDFIFSLFYRYSKDDCFALKIESPLVCESATSLAKKIRFKEVKCEEVVRAFVERCKIVNTKLNAVVDERFTAAILEAQDIDEQIAKGAYTNEFFASHPILGVPFTAAESLACEGMSCTLGILSRKDMKSKTDAKAIRSMREAGAILIAVTNVSQLGFWTETYNPIYGFTRNPYDKYRSVGGSCGGEASLVAACASPIGIGIDVGGCIRIPAHRCGVFGHKCSTKLVSVEDNPLFLKSTENTIAVVGPIVKFAEDLSLVLSVLVKDHSSELNLSQQLNSSQIQYFYSLRSFCGYASPIRSEVEDNMKKIVKIIGFYHTETKPLLVEVDETVDSVPLWGYKVSQEKFQFTSLVANNTKTVSPIREALKYIRGKRDYCLYTIYNLFGLVALKTGKDEELQIALDTIKELFLDILEGDSVLLFPTEPLPLGYPYQSLIRPFNNSYCALWNALEFPVTQVPIGLKNGLPFGVQVVAAPYKDHLCITAAKGLESLFNGYVEPESLHE